MTVFVFRRHCQREIYSKTNKIVLDFDSNVTLGGLHLLRPSELAYHYVSKCSYNKRYQAMKLLRIYVIPYPQIQLYVGECNQIDKITTHKARIGTNVNICRCNNIYPITFVKCHYIYQTPNHGTETKVVDIAWLGWNSNELFAWNS